MTKVLRVGNCSAFFGDRFEAAREMIEGGPLDFLTGDYLAELTLAILARKRMKSPGSGYAQTFVGQLEEIAETAISKGVRIVVNAGGLDPAACAEACREVYKKLGLEARVAHLEGDDVLSRLGALEKEGVFLHRMESGERLDRSEKPILTANAYLGARGIAKALDAGADLVICPRVTDASLVVGPAIHHFGWAHDDYDAIASAIVAGHILECGPQTTGGNYTRFEEVPDLERPGFPIAEIEEDGSFTVTKHEGTGGLVSEPTVKAQILYEITGPRYTNPDAIARFDTLEIEEVGPDRVRVSGVKGEPAPSTYKVSAHRLAGFRNRVSFVFRGGRVEEKAALAERTLLHKLGGKAQFAAYHSELEGGGDFGILHVGVRDPNPKKVGRAFTNRAVELGTTNYPGMNLTAPPEGEKPALEVFSALLDKRYVKEVVILEGERIEVEPAAPGVVDPIPEVEAPTLETPGGERELRQLRDVFYARSGDKGSDANLAIYSQTEAGFAFLLNELTVERLKELMPEAAACEIERFVFPKLKALNFVIHNFLDGGVAQSLKADPQAKALGEQLLNQKMPLPKSLFS